MKMYISDLIPRSVYSTWLGGKKVMIHGPTGLGKTTFVVGEFLPYCHERGQKALILCNRRILHKQYDYDLAEKYQCYRELCDDVDVMSYQELSEHLRNHGNISTLLDKYHVIVCDECHFFYSDSDFNSLGTYVTLQALVKACYFKTMLFISATLDEVKPLIEKTFSQCEHTINRRSGNAEKYIKYDVEYEMYDFSKFANYDRFDCCYAEDVETICYEVAKSKKKSIWFIDDKSKAEHIKKKLMELGGFDSYDILLLNSTVIEEKREEMAVNELAIGHKLPTPILLTTSVLDNGISIHDPDVGSIIIATESRVSFLQMLGRIRAESIDSCKLYIFPRGVDHYKNRIEQLEKKLKWAAEIQESTEKKSTLLLGWYGNDEKSDWIRNVLVLTEREYEYYSEQYSSIVINSRNFQYAINAFAIEKTGDLLLAERRFHKLAHDNPRNIAIHQFAWIGKSNENITILKSSYLEEKKEELIEKLLSVKNSTKEDVQKVKNDLVKRYKKLLTLLFDFPIKNGSFSVGKLMEICEYFELKYESYDGPDGRKRYTITPIANSERSKD